MIQDDKDRCEQLMKLAEFRMSRIVSRREHEWKVTVALWALLAAGVAKPPMKLFATYPCGLAAGLMAIVLGHAALWVFQHWRLSKQDVLQSFRYTDAVERHLGVPGGYRSPSVPVPVPSLDFFFDGKCVAQCATTGLLAVFVWLACSAKL